MVPPRPSPENRPEHISGDSWKKVSMQPDRLPICDYKSFWVEELTAVAWRPAVHHRETSEQSKSHVTASVNRSHRMCCDVRRCTEQTFSADDTDVTRQTSHAPDWDIISVQWFNIVPLRCVNIVFQLCKCIICFFSPLFTKGRCSHIASKPSWPQSKVGLSAQVGLWRHLHLHWFFFFLKCLQCRDIFQVQN